MPNDYRIAVLLPTRGRTQALDRSLLGLLSLAHDGSGIQVLLGLDTDDTVGIEHFQQQLQPKLDDLGVDYTAMSFEPMGYGRLHDYVNTLAQASSADWMFLERRCCHADPRLGSGNHPPHRPIQTVGGAHP